MLQATTASAGGILAGAREGILVCTPDLVLSQWNPAMEDITGIPARDAVGKPLADMLPFLHRTGSESPPARALAGEIVATPVLGGGHGDGPAGRNPSGGYESEWR